MSVCVGFKKALSVGPKRVASSLPSQARRKITARRAFSAAFFMLAMSASSGAMAQNCDPLMSTSFPGNNFDWKLLYGAGLAGANAISATINATNTAFLTHSTAFVSAPGNPPPDSEGGGVWIRGVGGESTTKSSGTTSISFNAPGSGLAPEAKSGNCNSTYKQSFAGVQVGTDIARLNVGGGWNIHLGATAGYLGTKGDINEGATPTGGAFNTTTQAPFVGTYAVATNGGFFIDGLLRFNYYETNLNSPSVNIYDQKLDAHGVSVGGSLGYHAVVPNSNWFVEPSAGLVWSRVSVDSLQLAGAPTGVGNFQGSAQINDITNTLGRAGLRVGATVDSGNMVLQPFASVNVFHDFSGSWSGTYSSCPGCIFLGPTPSQLTATMNGSGVGTYGVYSLGLAGQIKDTGWLGYIRLDYSNGANLEGWTGSGGIRYQFTPEAVRTAMITKAPVKGSAPVSWTGFYVGGLLGAAYKGILANGAEATFAPAPEPANHNTLVFPGTSATSQLAGILGGGTVGYNYQMGAWVLGVETDLAWTNARGSKACGIFSSPTGLIPTNALFNMTCYDSTDWLLTATGRLGYAWGRTLYFAKAGAAWTHENFSVTCNLGAINGTIAGQSCYNPAGVLTNQISASDNRMGWTIGAGTEFVLTEHWSAKGEVDYLSFGNRTLTANDGTIVSTKLSLMEAKIGVNYRFAAQ
jgi:opacity protein-like surface antigen